MATLTDTSTWETGVYQLETTDPVQGGAGGMSNCQPQQLANRTKKLYDTMADRGIFVNPAEQAFVGQPVVVSATFEGTVADGDMVYYHLTNTRFEKAIADGSAAQDVVGIADVTNGKVLASGLVATSRSDTPGDILYLSATVAGAITTSDTGVAIGRYQYGGIVFMAPAASAAASAASIAPGSVTPAMLQEHYYTDSEIDAKCGNWDTAYTERHQWDGGATNLVAATGRTSLGLTGDVSTHHHDSMYYTESEIDAKCGNWDNAWALTYYWDGRADGLVAADGRSSLGLTGNVTTHCHSSYYFTKAEINACCGNWDSAYTERRQWDGGATNLNAVTARTSLGLTGDVSTHHHDSMYPILSGVNTWTNRNSFTYGGTCPAIYACNNGAGPAACFQQTSQPYPAVIALSTSGCSIYTCTSTGEAIRAIASGGGRAVYACAGSSNNAVYGYSFSGSAIYGYVNSGFGTNVAGAVGISGNSSGVYGQSSGCFGVYGCSTSGAAVGGNTAYCNTSSKFLKHLEDVCISECLRKRPMRVQKYYWEDSNYTGFNQTIGPVAEDFNETFRLDHSSDGDGYDGVWSVDGVALGLGIENLNEIDRLKRVVVELHSCIKKLENK